MRNIKNSLPVIKQDGMGLLEVLVAIVVISFGLLGLGGLQITGVRNNHVAYMRSIATQQAQDIADRMRANKVGLAAGNYDSISGTPSANSCISTTTGCTPAQTAQQDTRQWNTNLSRLMPSGQGVVCIDGTPNDGLPGATACDGAASAAAAERLVIKIWWNENKDSTNLQRFVTTFQK
jgi:type IV pilus assembly protein PilV